MRKPKPQQVEIAWDAPESFALVPQQTIDGDRIAREAAQRVADIKQSESKQTEIKCGYQAFGFMPACVLPEGHNGDHSDGFGGFYGQLPPDTKVVQVPGSKELRHERT